MITDYCDGNRLGQVGGKAERSVGPNGTVVSRHGYIFDIFLGKPMRFTDDLI